MTLFERGMTAKFRSAGACSRFSTADPSAVWVVGFGDSPRFETSLDAATIRSLAKGGWASADFSREKPSTAVWPLPSAPKGRTNKAQANGLGLEMSLNPEGRAL